MLPPFQASITNQVEYPFDLGLALHSRADEWRSLFEILPVGISIIDEHKTVIYANTVLQKILHISPEALAGGAYLARRYMRSDGSPLPPGEFPGTRALLEQRTFANVEMCVEIEDGTRIWINVSAAPLPFPDARVLIVTTDITARRQAEEALRESEQKLEALFDKAPVPAVLTTLPDGVITDVNAAFIQTFGFSRQELVGHTSLQLGINLDSEARARPAAELDARGSLRNTEMRLHTKSGAARDFLVNVDQLQIAGRLHALRTLHDISERKRMEQAILQQNADLTALSQMSNALSRLVDPAELPGLIRASVGRILNTENITILLYDELSQTLSYAVFEVDGWPSNLPDRPLGNGLADYVIRTRVPLYLARDVQNSAAMLGIEHRGPAVESFLAVPMIAGDHVLGVIALYDVTHENAYGARHREVLSILAAQAAIALQNARLFTQTQSLAHTDALTGVANRLQLFEAASNELSRMRRFRHPLSVLLLDIDDFKHVNDTLGHAAGDEALRSVAQTCVAHVRATDLVARYGGEEFVILLAETHVAGACVSAERLRERIATSEVSTERGTCVLTVSIGVAGTCADDDEFDALMTRADAALYEAKRAGRNRVVVSGDC